MQKRLSFHVSVHALVKNSSHPSYCHRFHHIPPYEVGKNVEVKTAFLLKYLIPDVIINKNAGLDSTLEFSSSGNSRISRTSDSALEIITLSTEGMHVQ